jgi:hypothetical protein
MTKPTTTKDARLEAQKLHAELKLAEKTDDAEEERAIFQMAAVRCRKIHEYVQGQLGG